MEWDFTRGSREYIIMSLPGWDVLVSAFSSLQLSSVELKIYCYEQELCLIIYCMQAPPVGLWFNTWQVYRLSLFYFIEISVIYGWKVRHIKISVENETAYIFQESIFAWSRDEKVERAYIESHSCCFSVYIEQGSICAPQCMTSIPTTTSFAHQPQKVREEIS